jgi:hypothetical protein
METAEMLWLREVGECRNINCKLDENISEKMGMTHISEAGSG